MDTPILLPLFAFVGVLAVAFAASTLMNRRPAAVRQRLSDHAVQVAVIDAKRVERINVLKEPVYSTAPGLNTLLRRFRPARTAVPDLIHADVKLSVLHYLLMRLLVGVGLGLCLQLITQNRFYAIGAALVGLMLPRIYLIRRGRQRRKDFEDQLAEAIDLLVGALRSGYGFLQGIESVAREMHDPMKGELLRIIEQVNVGINPVDALQELTERIESYDLGLFASAISVQRQAGGNLAEVLENLANTIRERRRIRGEVHALTTGPRVSSYILGFIPVALLLYFCLISAEYREIMLGTAFGKMMLTASMVWSLIGLVSSQKVSKVEY